MVPIINNYYHHHNYNVRQENTEKMVRCIILGEFVLSAILSIFGPQIIIW